MTEEREEEVKEAGENIKGMKGARFLQTASELQQEVCPSVSGSTPLRDLSTGSVGIPNTPNTKPTPLPFCGMPLSVVAARASPVVRVFAKEWARVCR